VTSGFIALRYQHIGAGGDGLGSSCQGLYLADGRHAILFGLSQPWLRVGEGESDHRYFLFQCNSKS
jgi:hypothetical protein